MMRDKITYLNIQINIVTYIYLYIYRLKVKVERLFEEISEKKKNGKKWKKKYPPNTQRKLV